MALQHHAKALSRAGWAGVAGLALLLVCTPRTTATEIKCWPLFTLPGTELSLHFPPHLIAGVWPGPYHPYAPSVDWELRFPDSRARITLTNYPGIGGLGSELFARMDGDKKTIDVAGGEAVYRRHMTDKSLDTEVYVADRADSAVATLTLILPRAPDLNSRAKLTAQYRAEIELFDAIAATLAWTSAETEDPVPPTGKCD